MNSFLMLVLAVVAGLYLCALIEKIIKETVFFFVSRKIQEKQFAVTPPPVVNLNDLLIAIEGIRLLCNTLEQANGAADPAVQTLKNYLAIIECCYNQIVYQGELKP